MIELGTVWPIVVEILYLLGFAVGATLVSYSLAVVVAGGGIDEEDIIVGQLVIGFAILWVVLVW